MMHHKKREEKKALLQVNETGPNQMMLTNANQKTDQEGKM
jgi:hypothetical protein